MPSPVARESVSRAFKEAGERVCKDLNVGTHSARKTRSRLMYEAGESLAVISKMLNHSSIHITELYLDIRQDDVNNSYHTYQL